MRAACIVRVLCFLPVIAILAASSGCDPAGGGGDDGGGLDGGFDGGGEDAAALEPDADTAALDAVCTPGFALELLDDDPTRVGLFMDAMGGDPQASVEDIGRRVCRILYRSPEEVRNATHLTLRIENAVGEIAWKAGDGADITVMISTDHMANVSAEGRDVAREVRGILFHEMTHMYQHDDGDRGGVDLGLIEGIGDFVRFTAGYVPDGARPNPGGNWNDGYHTTAFFFVYVDATYPDFVYRLNLSMDNRDDLDWTPESFRTITGKSADELWSDYVASGP